MNTLFSTACLHFTALVFALLPAAGRGATPVAPDAGSLLQQISPGMAISPSPDPQLTIARQGIEAADASGILIPVTIIRIAGNTLFDTPTLHALVADAEGKSLTLTQLSERVDRITQHYRASGYPLAQAMILEQVMVDGVLVIEVVEARYGRITLNNVSRVRSTLLTSALSSLESGQPIETSPLDQALSRVAEIPGVALAATLKPGDAVGTADLLVNATTRATYAGNVRLDNFGNSSTGRIRLSATASVFNPLQQGDVLTVSGLSSGRGANYGRIAYDVLVSGRGLRVGAAYSTLHYILGGRFASLDANGTAKLRTVWASTTLKRGPKFDLHTRMDFEDLQLRDRVEAGGFRNDRHLSNGTVHLSGTVRDSILSSSITQWSASWRTGKVAFDDAVAEAADAATVNARGSFSKGNLNVSRLQRMGATHQVYLSFSGQWAGDNLDSSEKMIAGGPYAVRAYDVGAVAGDDGYVAAVEFRRALGLAAKMRWEGVVFADYARLKINHRAWTPGENRATLGGAGLGLNAATSKHWSIRLTLAARVGPVPALLREAASERVWGEISRRF